MLHPLVSMEAQYQSTMGCPACTHGRISTPSWEFSQTTVEVPTCDECQARGINSVKVRVSSLLGGK